MKSYFKNSEIHALVMETYIAEIKKSGIKTDRMEEIYIAKQAEIIANEDPA